MFVGGFYPSNAQLDYCGIGSFCFDSSFLFSNPLHFLMLSFSGDDMLVNM